jgi:hypothetical protein
VIAGAELFSGNLANGTLLSEITDKTGVPR